MKPTSDTNTINSRPSQRHRQSTAATSHTRGDASPAVTETKTGPVFKAWMIRIFQAAGISIPPAGSDRERLAWMGVEMQRFLGFSRTLPAETSLTAAMEAYGRELKSRQPAPESWRLDQIREALRAFRNGSENWQIIDGANGPEVKFRARALPEAESAPFID
jgi:hypothetical protein